MTPWCRRLPDGTLLVCIHAQPGAKRTGLAGLHGHALKVRVAAPAMEDRANQALAEFLAEIFQVARRDVALVAGVKSREKRFEIHGSAVDPGSIGA